MKPRWILRMALLGLVIPVATADILDDMKVPEEQFYDSVNWMGRNGPQSSGSLSFLEIPLSEKHVAGVEERLKETWGGSLVIFREGRGEWEQALEVERIPSLDRVRLLVRLGRIDEARAAIDVEALTRNTDASLPLRELLRACRPLEDTQSWQDLDTFLALLSETLVTPEWRAALWSEELDLAWHHDRLNALLEEAAKDPLRSILFHDRLGNDVKRDELATKLLAEASPQRMLQLLVLVPNCPLVQAAAIQMWNRDDLATQDRIDLFNQLTRSPKSADFLKTFTAWLAAGVDATPLAGPIWKRWSISSETPTMAATVAALLKLHPDEPTFQLMAAVQAITNEPSRAAELCEKVASQPLKLLPDAYPRRSFGNADLRRGPANLPLIAISVLGDLNRQDLIRARLDAHPDWPGLGAYAQARYLAAGKMDVALVDAILATDFSQPENDTLAWGFALHLETRLRATVMPRDIAKKIIGKFATMAAGSSQKPLPEVIADAQQLLSALGGLEADGWPDAVRDLLAIQSDRNATGAATLEQRLINELSRHPRLEGILPGKASEESKRRSMTEGMEATGVIQLFAPPEIRRISSSETRNSSRWSTPDSRDFNRSSSHPRLELLERWQDNQGNGIWWLSAAPPAREISPAVRTGIQTMMRILGPDDPRRLLAEIAIANGGIECGDPELKVQAAASFEALMAGTKEARGTEAFRYSLLEQAPDKADARMKILNEMKSQPPAAQKAFLRALENSAAGRQPFDRPRPNPQAPSFARRELGWVTPDSPKSAASPNRQPGFPAPDPDQAKLQQLFAQNGQASPEGIELAKRIIENAMSPGQSDPTSILFARTILVESQEFDAAIQAATDKARADGIPEVDVLRGLLRVDSRTTENGTSRVIEYARKIIALDPNDPEAARILLKPAATENNVELLLSCIHAVGTKGLSTLANEALLQSMSPQIARPILDFVRTQNVTERSPGSSPLAALHGYFLSSDPAVAAEFRSWLRGRDSVLASVRLPVAGQLLEAGDSPAAVDVIARCFVTAPEYPGFPYQFPPQPGKILTRQAGYTFDPKKLEADLAFLREHQLFAAVITRIEELGSPDPDAFATLRMAASPSAATFETATLPLLERKPDPFRGAIINQWIDLFSKQPESSALVLRLLEERAEKVDRVNPHTIPGIIEQAALLPGGSGLIAKLWQRLVDDGFDDKKALPHSRKLLLTMLAAADDPTWQNYWAWYSADFLPVVPSDRSPFLTPPDVFVDPARIRQVLPRWISSTRDVIPSKYATAWALVAIGTGEPKWINGLRAKLPPDAREAIELCELALGKPDAVEPIFRASRDADGDALVAWDLVSISPAYAENGGRDVPLHPISALDGKFEILITAASDPQRPFVVMKLPRAAASGHVRLKLAPDQHHVALVATDPTSGVIRMTPPVDLRKITGQPLPAGNPDLPTLGFERMPSPGPGGMPAWKVQLSRDQRIDLDDHPWIGLEPIAVSAWVLGEGKLQLRCLDAAGKQLAALEMIPWESSIPAWQFRSIRIPDDHKIPAATERVILCATTHGVANSPNFAFSGVRITVGPPVPLPPGFEKITRLFDVPVSMELSPDGKRLAVLLEFGDRPPNQPGELAIIDLKSGEVSRIPAILTSSSNRTWRNSEVRMLWNPSGLYLRDPTGSIFRMNNEGEKLDRLPIAPDARIESTLVSSDFAISGDGKWMASTIGVKIVLLASTDGIFRRELEFADRLSPGFTHDGLLLTARSQENSYFLKFEEFTSGEPTIVPTPIPPPAPRSRIRFTRDAMGRDADGITIPAPLSASAISSDGTVFFVDPVGNVIRATPPRQR